MLSQVEAFLGFFSRITIQSYQSLKCFTEARRIGYFTAEARREAVFVSLASGASFGHHLLEGDHIRAAQG